MGLFGGQHKPERSAARKVNVTDVNKTFMRTKVRGGFSDDAKAGRKWTDNKKSSGSPKGRGK